MVFDREAVLLRLGGDEELFREIAALFLADCPGMLEAIRQSIQTGDAAALEKAAHRLKGSVSNFGAEEAVQAAFDLETMGRKKDLSQGVSAYGRLETTLRAVQEALAQA